MCMCCCQVGVHAGWEISMSQPGAFSCNFQSFVHLVYTFVHNFVREPGAFWFSAKVNLPLVPACFPACLHVCTALFEVHSFLCEIKEKGHICHVGV